MNTELMQARLKELLDYDPDTGIFTWKKGRPKAKAGTVAGYVRADGCVIVKALGVKYFAHNLAFIYMKGDCNHEVYHINKNRSDNRWANLSESDRSRSMRRAVARIDNSSGVTGVTFDNERKKWIAQIQINGKHLHLGRHDEFHDAVIARYNEEVKYNWHKDNNDTDAKRYVESLTVNKNVQP